ncbi:YtxH domain-containing protein [Planococcus sp. CAU13]|uniref:YtxH domain-containing protein n=1 Tax=Planococcus sp. CAU13 TaxID=1541197 RepID=UPI000690D8A6|nr:YtxH domain-containing protein [Planococcus sp. CAU13]
MKASNFFIGLATGLAAGAAATLFSTPQSGEELRGSVKTASSDWKEKLADVKVQIDQLKESINTLKTEASTQVPVVVDGLKQSMAKWQEETGPAKEHLQLEILAIQNAIEELQKTISKDKKDDDNNEEKKQVKNPEFNQIESPPERKVSE